MVKRMLVDATHPEETRVVVLNGNRLEEFDFETSKKKQLKGNIYLAKVIRVEPSLQAAFVEYGGNRHGFLAFNEIHPDYYRLPIADREALIAETMAQGDPEDEPRPRKGRKRRGSRRGEAAESAPVDAVASDPIAGLDRVSDDGDVGSIEAPDGAPDDHDRDTLGADRTSGSEENARHIEDEGDGSASADALDPGTLASPFDAVEGEETGGYREAQSASMTDEMRGDDRSEPEPQAAEAQVVETVGGDEFDEVQPRRPRLLRQYKIQEVIARRQIMLVQVVKEERGTKGAALTTYLSLAGRYCVLMPNTPRGGGVSRKITSALDRKRLKTMLDDFELPDGMAVIVRTAGMERSKAEIKRDYEYLLRLWDEIRERTLQSSAPSLIHEEGDLIKRSIRDIYSRDIDEVLVEGDDGYKTAKAFMKMIVPSHARRVQQYKDPTVPLFHRYQVESQLDAIHSPTVQLRSGGYIVINPTEALVSIDVNSGRATRERHIEETAYKTNMEAAEEIARQLRLRDLAGLIVIDFIDMEDGRNNAAVERKLKEAMKNDRARIQIGRISAFGLLELSRQRLRPSLIEASTERCPHCHGTGVIRSIESTSLHVLRGVEEEGMRGRAAEILVHVPAGVALYILNQKRAALRAIEERYRLSVFVDQDETLIPPEFKIEKLRMREPGDVLAPAVVMALPAPVEIEDDEPEEGDEAEERPAQRTEESETAREGERRKKRRRRKRGGRREDEVRVATNGAEPVAERDGEPVEVDGDSDAAPIAAQANAEEAAEAAGERAKRRRRGRRGGRRRGEREGPETSAQAEDHAPPEDEGDIEDVSAEDGEPIGEEVNGTHQSDRGPIAEIAPPMSAMMGPANDEIGSQSADGAPAQSIDLITAVAASPTRSEAAEPQPAEAQTPHPAIDVVVVDRPSENPKRGWWGRLINK